MWNCRFVSNHADKYGGGIYNYNGSPAITNCIISRTVRRVRRMHICGMPPRADKLHITSNTAYRRRAPISAERRSS